MARTVFRIQALGQFLPIYPKQQPLEESGLLAMVLPSFPNLSKGLLPSYLSPGKREAAAWLPCTSPESLL